MNLGFSYVGLIYLAMLFIPNLFWTKNKPENYDVYVKNENRTFKIFESIGQVSVSCVVLIFKDFNFTIKPWTIWLALSFSFMVLYEVYWLRYFKSKKTMKDFYGSMLCFPVPGALLPVISFLLLGIYGKNIILIIATLILGIGHIGIHINHKKEI